MIYLFHIFLLLSINYGILLKPKAARNYLNNPSRTKIGLSTDATASDRLGCCIGEHIDFVDQLGDLQICIPRIVPYCTAQGTLLLVLTTCSMICESINGLVQKHQKVKYIIENQSLFSFLFLLS